MASSATSVRSHVRPKRFGSETPRIFTRPLRRLTARTSLGFAVIEFAETVLEMQLLPWQKWLLIHMLELLADNSLRFRTVIVLVARQNGKSTLSQVVALWFMYVYHVALVIGTAQDLDVAEEIWQGAVDLVLETDDDDQPVRPDLRELLDKVVMVNGKKSLNLKTGERYKVKAANRRAGRGLSGDLVLLDELREHQSWDAWGAITKTTMARANALVLALSNAGDRTSVVLAYLRRMAIAALVDSGRADLADELKSIDELIGTELDRYIEEGIDEAEEFANEGDDSVGIFEWSARPGCSIHDRDGWAQANPSLGYTITERTIASAASTDPEWIFRTEVLCQWADRQMADTAIKIEAWDDLEDVSSKFATVTAFAVATDLDRAWSSIGAAGPAVMAAGWQHIELIERARGTQWVVPRCVELNARHGPVVFVVDSGGPAGSLIEPLENAGLEVQSAVTKDVARSYGMFIDAIRDRELRHGPDPLLAAAVQVAKPRACGTDGGLAFGRRRSVDDITPIETVSLAYWAAITRTGDMAAVNNVW